MIYYPTANYETAPIKAWYWQLKQQSTCPCCQIMQPTATPIEYHHLDRSTKIDTLSNLVHFSAPLRLIMAETFKVTPLCREHHVRYHRLERLGHTDLIHKLYDFENDKFYQKATMDFHAMAWANAPRPMQSTYLTYLKNGFDILGAGYKPRRTPQYG
jgi:hypothetical protein